MTTRGFDADPDADFISQPVGLLVDAALLDIDARYLKTLASLPRTALTHDDVRELEEATERGVDIVLARNGATAEPLPEQLRTIDKTYVDVYAGSLATEALALRVRAIQ